MCRTSETELQSAEPGGVTVSNPCNHPTANTMRVCGTRGVFQEVTEVALGK